MSLRPGQPRWSEIQPLPPRPAWMKRAHCAGLPTSMFFPVGEDNRAYFVAAAKAVCRQCAVAPECLAWAIEHQEVGIWGMTTRAERRRMARAAGKGER